MEELSARTRAANLEAMERTTLDVLVIGGGIVGAWIALTSALRGHRTGLVEKGDFASGTSGKTSRLIHGGLRYLQQFRIGIVRQAARERDVLLRIAPRLVKPLTFLIPVYRRRGPKGWQLRFGLWLYDALSREKVLPGRRWVSRDEALQVEPRLDPNGLVRAALYSDAYAHDARLVMEVVKAAAKAGALVANYARVSQLLREPTAGTLPALDPSRGLPRSTLLVREWTALRGARVEDLETGRMIDVRASAVVNASGAWSEGFQSTAERVRLRPTKGIHLFVPRERIGHERAVVLTTKDRRTVFVLPWGPLSMIGTTDTDYRGDKDRVEADRADVDYLLDAVNAGFPGAGLAPRDIVSTYAGLRPLVDTGEARESDISRKHEIHEDADGLITVMGGKLTTARAMAGEVLMRIEARPAMEKAREGRLMTQEEFRRLEAEPRSKSRVDTRSMRLADPPAAEAVARIVAAGASEETAARLAEITAAGMALDEGLRRPGILRPLVPGQSVTELEIRYNARHEMALHLDDVMVRRSGLAYLMRDHGLHVAPMVAELMGEELGWDAEGRASEMARYRSWVEAMDRWRGEPSHG